MTTDVLTPEQRSRNMSAIRSRGNQTTEERFVQLLREAHITGWRRHVSLPGKPDFVFPGARLAVFLDGCFWHGCPRCYRRPTSHTSYWDQKLQRNVARDSARRRELRKLGWRVLRIWEHTLKKHPLQCVVRVSKALEERAPARYEEPASGASLAAEPKPGFQRRKK
jgi:DNA mismatch endonuclease (patch repair protein)